MANLFDSIFRKVEKPQDTHPPSDSCACFQYGTEFVTYCIEQEQTLTKLESEIHTTDDPKEIVMQTLRTACAFYNADWAGIVDVDLELGVTNTGWWHNANPKSQNSTENV